MESGQEVESSQKLEDLIKFALKRIADKTRSGIQTELTPPKLDSIEKALEAVDFGILDMAQQIITEEELAADKLSDLVAKPKTTKSGIDDVPIVVKEKLFYTSLDALIEIIKLKKLAQKQELTKDQTRSLLIAKEAQEEIWDTNSEEEILNNLLEQRDEIVGDELEETERVNRETKEESPS